MIRSNLIKKMLLISLISLWYFFILANAFHSDLSLTMVTHTHTDIKIKTSVTDTTTIIRGDFTAPYNYLGMLFIHFDLFNEPANEEVVFVIRDLSSNKVVLNAQKLSGQIISQPQFPIGIAPILNSQNKQYSFEVSYTTSAFKNPLTVNTSKDTLITKYLFPQEVLLIHPELLISKIVYGFKTLPLLLFFVMGPIVIGFIYIQKRLLVKTGLFFAHITCKYFNRLKKQVKFNKHVSVVKRRLQNIYNFFLIFQKKVISSFHRFNIHFISNKKLTKNRLIIFFSIATLSLVLKVIISQTWYNFDIESMKEVSDIVLNGKSVYAHTWRYNYGPIWSYILGLLGYIRGLFGFYHLQDFHLVIAVFLSIVDIILSFVIIRLYGFGYGILFLLNPVSILLSGFHSQFENLAILIAFIGWIFFIKSIKTESLKRYRLSAMLFGVSMIIKHIFIFFPFWLLFYPSKFKLKEKIIHFCTIYAVFIGGFVFDITIHLNEASNIIEGIQKNVIHYKSQYGYSFLAQSVNIFFTENLLSALFGWVPVFKDLMFIFFCLVLASGYFLIKKKIFHHYLIPLYLLSFYIFSPSVADQYFAISLIMIVLSPANFLSLISLILIFFHIASIGYSNINSVLIVNADMFVHIGHVIFPLFPWRGTQIIQGLNHLYAQAWIFLFFLSLVFRGIQQKVKNIFSIIVFGLFIIVTLYFVFQIILFIIMYQNQHTQDKITSISTTNNICSSNVLKKLEAACLNKRECIVQARPLVDPKNCIHSLKIEWSCNNITKYRILGKDIKKEFHLKCMQKK